ncbi:MAG TPA: prolyl oligopeptidase family serine peptidase [Polyangiaceae bacterium]|nr:prolyl oligopeptidase family serine peptidase [Polyangiaceae bacterium]
MKRTKRQILPFLACTVGAGFMIAGCSSDNAEPSAPGSAGRSNHSQAGATASAGAAVGGSGIGGQSSGAGGNGASGIAGSVNSSGGSSAGGSAGSSSGVGGHASSVGGSASGGSGTGGAGGKSGGTGGNGASGGSGGSSSTTTGMSAGCGKAPTIASNMYNNGKNIPITVGSMQRRYILSVPTNYNNTKPYKLVIAYHQRDGNDNQMYANKYYHLQPLSNDTTIFVAPNGQLNNAPCSGTGNGESSCGWPNPNDSDMNFADAVVKAVEESFCIDTNRIFATGWSYGGSMSYATACERPLGATNGYIRAIAVYSGSQLSGQCTPSKPVGYYASHGTADDVLCYDGNSSGCQVGNGMLLAQNFAKANGCTWATPQKVTSGNHACTTLMGCMSGYPEEFCSFNGPHTPDPKDPGQGNSWEYQKAWDFLNQF